MHQFEGSTAGNWCRVPNPDRSRDRAQECCQPPEHPIHQVDNPLIEYLAGALARKAWRPPRPGEGDDPSWSEMTEHRRHSQHADCALCNGDVHAIAAEVITILLPVLRGIPRGGRGATRPAMPRELAVFLATAYPPPPPPPGMAPAPGNPPD